MLTLAPPPDLPGPSTGQDSCGQPVKIIVASHAITAAGGKAIGVVCDVSDEAQVAAMVERTVTTFGRLDAAFNNAGIQVPALEIADQSAEDYDRISAINQRGV